MKPGTYVATVAWHALTEASRTGTDQIAVGFQVDTPEGPQNITWYGVFTDNPTSVEISLDALRNMGWDAEADGFDITALNGTDTLKGNQCQIVVQEEEFEGKPRVRVRFVNRMGGAEPMDAGKAKSLADRIKAQVIAHSKQNPAHTAPKAEAKPQEEQAPPDDEIDLDDIPF